jgi:hypothetical protein
MKLDLKFGIGDIVYIVYKEKKEVKVFKDVITEFAISKQYGLVYYTENFGDEIKEEDMIRADEPNIEVLLKAKIDELLRDFEIEKRIGGVE